MKILSRFNVFFESQEKFFVYNTLSSAIIELNNDYYKKMQNGIFPDVSSDEVEIFYDEGIIVDKAINEVDLYLHYYDKYRLHTRMNTLNIALIPTYNCNLACKYCYQGEEKQNKHLLTIKDTKRVYRFIKEYIQQNKEVQKLNVSFYGGEPLICFDFCKAIMKNIHTLCKKEKIKLTSLLVTNGLLFSEKTITEFVKPFDVHIQLTIDGLYKKHDDIRKTKSGKGTFKKTQEIIDLMHEHNLKDNITLRTHLSDCNIGNAEKIISFFKDKTNDFYFAFIEHYSGKNDSFKDCCAGNACVINHNFTMHSLIKKYGFSEEAVFGKRTPCSLNSVNTFFIDSMFDVYNCSMMLQNNEGKIGTIDSKGHILMTPQYYSLMRRTPDRFSKCLKCKTLPTCASGCAANAAFANGSVYSPLCEIDEEKLISYLKDYILLNEM